MVSYQSKSLQLSLIILGTLASSCSSIHAELIQDEKGNIMTEDQYIQRVQECKEMQSKDHLESNIDCTQFVLTEKGYLQIYSHALSESVFDESVIDDIWKK